jgi:uncharacterized membrane protein
MRKIIAFLLAAFMLATSAHAISIGRAGGFSARTVTVSRPAMTISRPAMAPATTRIGGGQTVGMTRPDVMQSVRQPAVAPTRGYTQPQATSVMTPSQVTAAPRSGPGWGTVGAAAVGGALVGHMMTGPSHGTTVVNAGGYAGTPAVVAGSGYVPGAGAVAAPAYGYGYGAGFVGGLVQFLYGLFVVLILAVVAYFIFRLVKTYFERKEQEAAAREKEMNQLPFSPLAKFWSIQRAFAAGDRTELANLLGPDMGEFIDGAPSTPQDLTISGASHSVIDRSQDVISIRFRARDYGDSHDIDEVWHFVPKGESWVLNGIEQV